MNTLQQLKAIMAAHNYYMAADIPAKYNFSGARDLHIPDGIPANYAVGHFLKCGSYTDGSGNEVLYVESNGGHIVVMRDGCNVPMRLVKEWNADKYHFHLDYALQKGYPNEMMRKASAKAGAEPNKIGAWSQKKVDAWQDYVCAYYAALVAEKSRVSDLYTASKAELESIISALGNGAKTRQNNDGHDTYKTYVHANGFDFTFEISKVTGHIYKNVTYRGTIEHALQLAAIQPAI